METIQDLFKICFTRGINTSSSSIISPSLNNGNSNGNGSIYGGGESNGSNYTFKSKSQYSNYSLQIHAALSRSKWLISRFIEECIQPTAIKINNQNPIRQISEFIGLKPFVCVNCISLSIHDIWLTIIKLQKITKISSSIWTNEIREYLLKFDTMLNSYPEKLWKTSKKSYVLQLFQKDKLFLQSEDIDHPAIRELTSINWILNTTKNVLKSIYESKSNIPHDITLLKELISLKESIESRRNIIQLCLQDLHSLHIYEELCSIYRSEILLLVEMIGGQNSNNLLLKDNQLSKLEKQQQRSEEEFVFTLSKLCNRQFEIDCKISNRNMNSIQYINEQSNSTLNSISKNNMNNLNNINNYNYNTPSKLTSNLSPNSLKYNNSEYQSPRRKKTSSNSLHMLLQNVFPTNDIQKKIEKLGNN